MFGHASDETHWWLRSDGTTQVATECVPQVVDEIIEVVRLILQERVQQRTVEQIVHVPTQVQFLD